MRIRNGQTTIEAVPSAIREKVEAIIKPQQKGSDIMQAMAEFFVWRIINGRTTYANVPSALKPLVAEILTEEGFAQLIIE